MPIQGKEARVFEIPGALHYNFRNLYDKKPQKFVWQRMNAKTQTAPCVSICFSFECGVLVILMSYSVYACSQNYSVIYRVFMDDHGAKKETFFKHALLRFRHWWTGSSNSDEGASQKIGLQQRCYSQLGIPPYVSRVPQTLNEAALPSHELFNRMA